MAEGSRGGSGDIIGNQVTIADSNITGGSIYGGASYGLGNVTGNSVVISDGTTSSRSVFGGYINSADSVGVVSRNQVTITGKSNITLAVYGAQSRATNGEVANNQVTIEGESSVTAAVYGGYGVGTVTGNGVKASTVTLSNRVYGGFGTASADVTNNWIELDDVELSGYVYGGYSSGSGDVIGNSVKISGSKSYTSAVRAYGGQATSGDANQNRVEITGGTFAGNIYGGFSTSGSANNNVVVLSGGKFSLSVTGGQGDVSANNNAIVLKNDADVSDSVQLNGYAGNATSGAYGNSLIIDNSWTGSTINRVNSVNNIGFSNLSVSEGSTDKTYTITLVGASTQANTVVGSFDVNENTDFAQGYQTGKTTIRLNATNLSTDASIGGTLDYSNAQKDHVVVTDNGVRIHGFDVTASATTSADNKSTEVEVEATVNKSVIAGIYTNTNGFINKTDDGDYYYGLQTKSAGNGTLTIADDFETNASVIAGSYAVTDDATGGTIVLKNNTNAYDLLGGYTESQGGTVSGNTLVVDGSGLANTVNAFDEVSFRNVALNSETVALTVNEASDLSKARFSIALAGGSVLSQGDTINLIDGDVGEFDSNANVTIGIGTDVYGTVTSDGTGLTFAAVSGKASAQTQVLTEARSATTAFVNQGFDMVTDSLNTVTDREEGLMVFVATTGTKGTYETTGNDVDVKGWNTLIGVGHKTENFAVAAFFENGDGNYSTFVQDIRHDGDVEYNGGGLMARYGHDNGLYMEGSLRAGVLSNEQNGALVDQSSGRRFDYDTDSTYYAGHIGLGMVFDFGGGAVDAYAKYLYTYQEGESLKLNGESFELDSVDSSRLRLGARFSNQNTDGLKFYMGAAWEYEFDGKATGTANGFDIEESSLKGSTVIGEFGATYRPGQSWFIDAGVKGFGGQRTGLSGNVQVKYLF